MGDATERVAQNRERLCLHLGLPAPPCWLRQVHGRAIVAADPANLGCEADGSIAEGPGSVCAVMTADCLPLLICDQGGTRVAAVHAGWRGLLQGVVDRAVAAMETPPDCLLVWLGPAIGPEAFEVGAEVRARFVAANADAAVGFRPSPSGRWLADLFLLARQRLAGLGVGRIYGGGECTFSQPRRFFSYRRDGVTGRMASLIWLAADDSEDAA